MGDKVERDIGFSEDVKESGIQGGKVLGNNLALFSFIAGIPLIVIGVFGLVSMVFDLGFPVNGATVIMVLIVLCLGSMMTAGGYFLCKK